MWRVVVLTLLNSVLVMYFGGSISSSYIRDPYAWRFQSSPGDSRPVCNVADGCSTECCMDSFRVLIFDLFRMRLSEDRMWQVMQLLTLLNSVHAMYLGGSIWRWCFRDSFASSFQSATCKVL